MTAVHLALVVAASLLASGCKMAESAAPPGPRCADDRVHDALTVQLDGTSLLTAADVSSLRVTARNIHILLRPDASGLLADKTSEKVGKELTIKGRNGHIAATIVVAEAITGGRIALKRPEYDGALDALCASVVGRDPKPSGGPVNPSSPD